LAVGQHPAIPERSDDDLTSSSPTQAIANTAWLSTLDDRAGRHQPYPSLASNGDQCGSFWLRVCSASQPRPSTFQTWPNQGRQCPGAFEPDPKDLRSYFPNPHAPRLFRRRDFPTNLINAGTHSIPIRKQPPRQCHLFAPPLGGKGGLPWEPSSFPHCLGLFLGQSKEFLAFMIYLAWKNAE